MMVTVTLLFIVLETLAVEARGWGAGEKKKNLITKGRGNFSLNGHKTRKNTVVFSCIWLFVTPWTVASYALSIGILQARILERVAKPSSRGYSQPRDQIHIYQGSNPLETGILSPSMQADSDPLSHQGCPVKGTYMASSVTWWLKPNFQENI